jgi:uncharacterized protein (DUF1330 family)
MELMTVYPITQVTARDPRRLRPYLAAVAPLIVRHGGEVVDVVRATGVLEGSWPDGAFSAVVRFRDLDALQAFWSDPDYEAPRRLRHEIATTTAIVAESVL